MAGVDELHEETEEVVFMDARGGDIDRLRGHAMEKGIEVELGDGTRFDEVNAKAPALVGLLVEGGGELIGRDEPGLYEQVAEPHASFHGAFLVSLHDKAFSLILRCGLICDVQLFLGRKLRSDWSIPGHGK
jgi:hypothetical protein